MSEHQCKHEKELKDLETMVKKVHDRMFIDNGKLSFQTIQDRQQRMLNALMWIITATTSAVIGMTVKTIFAAIQK